jgi:hypothetical protein
LCLYCTCRIEGIYLCCRFLSLFSFVLPHLPVLEVLVNVFNFELCMREHYWCEVLPWILWKPYSCHSSETLILLCIYMMCTWDTKFRNSDTCIMYIFRLQFIWDNLKMCTELVKLYVQVLYMILLSLMVYNAHIFLQTS